MESDSDDDTCYVLTDPILKLQRKIKERISIYNYLKICVNVCWLVEDHLLEDATINEKITLAVCVLESVNILRPLRDVHFSMIENLYSLAEHPDRLEKLRKKVSWYQYWMSFIN